MTSPQRAHRDHGCSWRHYAEQQIPTETFRSSSLSRVFCKASPNDRARNPNSRNGMHDWRSIRGEILGAREHAKESGGRTSRSHALGLAFQRYRLMRKVYRAH
ncbi:hypothetical protein AVEN_52313-1 [Araneus ventricosus]|uniref:Uncharacterized protein n=1 Tax=Araneus ventricosus TaxID=182803 RepID=A0A4Y2GLC3_ARAVE|nr:hypothetical protein AVEN_52313-1 [Araneus ventricosus]